MTYEKRNWLARLLYNDTIGGLSLMEIVGTAAVVVHLGLYLWGLR
jgi:hypothetical protein